MHEDIGGEIILRAGESEAQFPDIPKSVLEAIHRSIIGAQESLSVRRARSSVCKNDDIVQLCHLLNQWVEPFKPLTASSRLSVIVSPNDKIRGDKRASFNSLESYLLKFPGRTEATRRLTLMFDSTMTGDGRIDRVSLEVELTASSVRYSSMIDINADNEDQAILPSDGYNATIRVRYTNYLVAKSLVDVFDEWFASLEELEQHNRNPAIEFIATDHPFDDYSPRKQLVRWVPIILALFIIHGFLVNEAFAQWREALSLPSIALLGAVICAGLSIFFGELTRRYDEVSLPRRRHLLLTQGDERLLRESQLRMAKKRARRDFLRNTIVAGFLVSVAASIAVNII